MPHSEHFKRKNVPNPIIERSKEDEYKTNYIRKN